MRGSRHIFIGSSVVVKIQMNLHKIYFRAISLLNVYNMCG